MGHVRLLFRLIPDSLVEYMMIFVCFRATMLDLRVICWTFGSYVGPSGQMLGAKIMLTVLGRLRPYGDARAA